MSHAMAVRAQPHADPGGARRLRLRQRAAAREDEGRSLEELRRPIVGPERERIERLEGRAPVAAEPVGAVLPEAIATATTSRQRDLATALEPAVTDAVKTVARRRPDVYAEALAPAIGSAVKKAVADAMAVIIERFDAALERSLTLRSIQWRIESARTGRSFGEIALLHTLVYRVEQVFLIHTNTSLVLQHLVDPMIQAPAADQVAAMLSAIEAFAREAFGPSPPEVHLNRFELGELTVWISHDPSLTLAAVVRGTPSAAIAPQMVDTLSRVRIRCAVGLRDFAGDAASFDDARPILEALLLMVRRRPPRRAKMILAAAAAALLAAVIALVSWSQVHKAAIARREGAYVAALQGEPGIVVNQVRWKGGKARFSGLRDALAAPPEDVLAEHGLAPAAFELAPFVSLDPRIVERRAGRVLRPPPGVRVSVEGHDLVVAGTAASHWVDEARLLGRMVPGVERVDDSALRSAESLDALRGAASRLDTPTVTFATGSSQIADQEAALGRAADSARLAIDAAVAARVGACLVVTGHTDASGTAERNGSLSVERASVVGARLAAMDIDGGDIRPVGTSSLAVPLARSVTFHLDIDETRFAPGCGGPP